MTSRTGTLPRVFAFPMKGIAYNECLYAAAAKKGLTVQEGVWAGRWLLSNVSAGDIVHIHWPSFLYYDPSSAFNKLRDLARFFLRYAIVRLRRGRVVWTAHNLYPHDGGRNEWSHRLVRRFIAASADLIIAHGPSARAALKSEFGVTDDKIVEVQHGNWIGYHPHTVTKEAARRALDIPANAYVYSIVGACRPYKNLEALITAFQRLGGDCFLLIAGRFQSKDYQTRIERLLSHLPASRYRMDAGVIPNDKIQNFVVASDVLVLPYTEILTSGSAMLGLSFGVPVIVPNIGGMADVINDTCGLLYDAKTDDGLLHAMQDIRSRRYSSAVILEYARSFDWMTSAEALVASMVRLQTNSGRLHPKY
jgi:beta-1,4-mannosyltransferase